MERVGYRRHAGARLRGEASRVADGARRRRGGGRGADALGGFGCPGAKPRDAAGAGSKDGDCHERGAAAGRRGRRRGEVDDAAAGSSGGAANGYEYGRPCRDGKADCRGPTSSISAAGPGGHIGRSLAANDEGGQEERSGGV